MSKNSRRRIIQRGIEEQDAYYQEKARKEREKNRPDPNEAARPNLLKRFASILLDMAMICSVIFGLYLFSYYVVFPHIGYTDALQEMRDCYTDSGLYIYTEEGKFELITSHYDANKSPSDNYDGVITHYYTVNERAVSENRLWSYEQAKKSSGLFEEVAGQIVEKETADAPSLKTFYENQYSSAVEFHKADPILTRGSNKTLLITALTMMVCGTISAGIFYFAVPMCRKQGETIGQMACKLVLVNEEDRALPKRKQIAIRFFMVWIMDFILPVSLFILWSWAAGFPILVNFALIAFKKNQASFHDFFSKTVIINRSRSDAFAALDAMKGQQTN